jgi:hypothetical protein
MEQYTKHLLNILRHQDLTFAHSIHFARDLSIFLSCNSVVLLSCAHSRLVCVLVLWLSLLCVCCYSLLTPVLIRDLLCKMWETPKCGDSSQGDKLEIKKNYVIQVDHWITWKGLSATLVRWDATTWTSQVFHLAEPWDKNRRVTCLYSYAILSTSTHFIIALSLILIL